MAGIKSSRSNNPGDNGSKNFKKGNDEVGCFIDGPYVRDIKQFFKLWICDIQMAPASPVRANAILFKKINVEYVHVFGTITQVKDFSTKVLFEVDDCTGTINCVYNLNTYQREAASSDGTDRFEEIKNEQSDKANDEDVTQKALSNISNWLQIEILRNDRRMQERFTFNLGDTVCLKGFIKPFHGRREIRVFQLHKIDLLDDETAHILEKIALYKNEYDKM